MGCRTPARSFPDGTYHYHVEAWDDNNNQGKSPEGTVVVDTVPADGHRRTPPT